MSDYWILALAIALAFVVVGCGSAVQTHSTAIRIVSGTHAVGVTGRK